MTELLGGLGAGGGLTCVYFALVTVGVVYALVILIGGGLGDGADAGLGGDFDVGGADSLQGSVDVTHVSPVTIAGFVTAFGAFGIIALGLAGASAPASLLWASIGGLVVGLASHLAFIYFFIKPQGSSEVTRQDVIGAPAEVITPIPSGGLGEVAFVAQGGRVTMSARGLGGAAIDRGCLVRIQEQVGSTVVVAPVDATTSEEEPR